jgi:hypothetical protein
MPERSLIAAADALEARRRHDQWWIPADKVLSVSRLCRVRFLLAFSIIESIAEHVAACHNEKS